DIAPPISWLSRGGEACLRARAAELPEYPHPDSTTPPHNVNRPDLPTQGNRRRRRAGATISLLARANARSQPAPWRARRGPRDEVDRGGGGVLCLERSADRW